MLLIIPLFYQKTVFAQAVKKIPADKQRLTQWKPEKGQYYFSHSLVYEYENKAAKTKGTIRIYLDPVSGAMCFLKDSSFMQKGKSFDLVIGFPNGKYTFYGTDDAGKKTRISETVNEMKPDPETVLQQKEDFATYCLPTANKRTEFGLESMEYNLGYATSDTKDKIWLAKTPFSVYALYGLEFVESAVSLPVSFDYMHLLDADRLITEFSSKDTFFKLVRFGRDPYTAITKGYQESKRED
ncbi:hypothetical protein FEM33_00970 [Dyadobacter flavalbus]|uniref:DUF4412 domain-containing protein n=1 Tax=Dyadobacter flavalbus TaxID=2579942 RepID=A0A5M8R2Y3_9BACT|nr:hypothetical protein FEM33_00970 [Dyadobacter flavalbus]